MINANTQFAYRNLRILILMVVLLGTGNFYRVNSDA